MKGDHHGHDARRLHRRRYRHPGLDGSADAGHLFRRLLRALTPAGRSPAETGKRGDPIASLLSLANVGVTASAPVAAPPGGSVCGPAKGRDPADSAVPLPPLAPARPAPAQCPPRASMPPSPRHALARPGARPPTLPLALHETQTGIALLRWAARRPKRRMDLEIPLFAAQTCATTDLDQPGVRQIPLRDHGARGHRRVRPNRRLH